MNSAPAEQAQKITWRERYRALGPGLLMATAAIGGSHLVASTQSGALFGWQLAWVILLVNVLKYPFFRFAVHYTLTEEKSLVQGYYEKGKAYLWAFIALCVVAAIVNTAGVLLLTASLLHYVAGWLFTTPFSVITLSWLMLIGCLTALLIGRYRLLDSLAKLLMLVLTITTITALVVAWGQGSQTPADFVSPSPWELASLGFVVAMMGWMPAPIEISAINSVWLRTKRQLDQVNLRTGLTDFNVGFWTTTVLALVFLSLGALVQHGAVQDVAMAGGPFAQQLVDMYASTIGEWSRWLVALIAFLCMVGTTLTVLDGYARVLTESFSLLLWHGKRGSRALLSTILMIQAALGMAMIIFFAGALGPMLTFAMTLAFLTTPVFAWLNFNLVRQAHCRVPVGRLLQIWAWLGLIYLLAFTVMFLLWGW